MKSKLKALVAAALMAALPFAASGATIAGELTLIGTFPGNDCQGALNLCFVGNSPAMIKLNAGGELAGEIEFNAVDFPSLDGSEFTFDVAFLAPGSDFPVGTWSYTPGPGDPSITALSYKYGPSYDLYSYSPVPQVVGNTYTGTWDLSNGLSHVTFYDTKGDDFGRVPEPGSLALLLAAGAGLLGAARRARRRA